VENGSHPGLRLGHVPALDGIRGIAIALVLLDHAGWLPGGSIGVDVFFTLSGYLITTLLLAELDAHGRVDIRAFYERRVRRLLPALGAVLLVVALTSQGGPGYILTRISVAAFYIANLWRAAGHDLPGSINQVWSLAEEEQFYLIWPAALLVMARWRKQLPWLLLGLTVGAAAWRVMVAVHAGPNSNRVYFSPDTRADPLLLGCALATLPKLPRIPTVAAVGGLAALLAVAATTPDGYAHVAAGIPVAAVAAVFLICASLRGGYVARLLSLRPLVGLGAISYSLYLWQGPVFGMTYMVDRPLYPVAAAVSVGVAYLSYRYIERPFRRRRRPGLEPTWQSVQQRPAQAEIVLPAPVVDQRAG
jgi:peptidoglycan/LPS O-acetylase OafA/YrhL